MASLGFVRIHTNAYSYRYILPAQHGSPPKRHCTKRRHLIEGNTFMSHVYLGEGRILRFRGT